MLRTNKNFLLLDRLPPNLQEDGWGFYLASYNSLVRIFSVAQRKFLSVLNVGGGRSIFATSNIAIANTNTIVFAVKRFGAIINASSKTTANTSINIAIIAIISTSFFYKLPILFGEKHVSSLLLILRNSRKHSKIFSIDKPKF